MPLPLRSTLQRAHGPALSLLEWQAVAGAPVLLCLHGHFGQGWIYHSVAKVLAPQWRVVAFDQRGHGFSEHGHSYERDDYLADLLAVFDAQGMSRAVLLGSSLGGVNAYQFAARYPERVEALIIEDIGAVRNDDCSWCLNWPRRFPSLAAMREAVHPYFCESAVQREDGWDFRFDRQGMVRSQQALNGDGWAEWCASGCPALLLHGGDSTVLSTDHALMMVAKRPHTTLRQFPGVGHNINAGDPPAFQAAVVEFLQGLSQGSV